MEDGNLTIKTSFAGKIKIPYDQINSFTSDAPLTFRMDDNRTLNGTVQFAQDGNFTISDQGEKFSPSKIRHLWSENMDDPLISAAQKTAEEMMMKWEHAFGLDLTGSSGNSENFGLGMRLDSNLGNKLRGYDLYLSYNKADKKNTPIVDETKFGIEYDSRFFDALSWYAKTDLENDKLEEIDLRATSSLGLKYSWIEQRITNFQHDRVWPLNMRNQVARSLKTKTILQSILAWNTCIISKTDWFWRVICLMFPAWMNSKIF